MPSVTTYINRFDSWNEALKAAGLLVNIGRTNEELIGQLRAKAESLGRTPMIKDLKSDKSMPSAATYIDRFSSWNEALKAAGLSVNVGYTNEELIGLLKAKAKSLGRTPTIKDVNSDKSMPHANTYTDRFGSWNQALKAAGLTPNRRGSKE